MIITRTPFRISFFGGGSDIPAFFREEGGQVLSTSIDKYCYVTVRHLPPFFSHSIRLAYSRLETCDSFDKIQHPLIRVALQDFNREQIEIHYDADLPGNSGLGSSSSFGVGLANCLTAMDGLLASRKELAERVIHWERNILNEAGGYQDQIAAAYGGLNHIRFSGESDFSVSPYPLTKNLRSAMLGRMILCYIPKSRLSDSVSVAREIDKKTVRENLKYIRDAVDEGLSLLQSGDLDNFGSLLHENWLRKRAFSHVTDQDIDDVYNRALNSGAIGGKLLGAGGGGFMLIWCKDDNRDEVIKALAPLLVVPFDFDYNGTQIIYFSDSI
ncbi:MAG: kinase [Deltaproteobacteria bacterium]|jgi:D-glycero-alpha-D-manno-heptose-7-phosphate kinase|nr:kinase [Deltaproteobacteria bacterium]